MKIAQLRDLRDIETKTKQDNGILEQFLGTKGQSSIQLFIGREKGMEKHAYEIAKTGAPMTGKNPPKYQDRMEMRGRPRCLLHFLIEMT